MGFVKVVELLELPKGGGEYCATPTAARAAAIQSLNMTVVVVEVRWMKLIKIPGGPSTYLCGEAGWWRPGAESK